MSVVAALNIVQGHASQGAKLSELVKERWKETGEHTAACGCRSHYYVWRNPSACLYSFSETALGISSLPVYVSQRLSEPAPFITLQQPSSNWAVSPPAVIHTSSTLRQKRYRCTWSGTALSQHTSESHLNRMGAAEPQQLR